MALFNVKLYGGGGGGGDSWLKFMLKLNEINTIFSVAISLAIRRMAFGPNDLTKQFRWPCAGEFSEFNLLKQKKLISFRGLKRFQ